MPEEVASGVYDITAGVQDSGKRYRVYLSTEGVPTLFDVGLEATADAVIEGIADVGVEPERVVITHGDGDHIGALDTMVAEYNPETWVPEQTTVDAEATPDHRYGDGDEIGRYTAVHLPGHSEDNHALVDEAAGVAILGDAVSGADQRGLPKGHFHLPPAVYSDNLNQAEESLVRLLDFEFSIGLVYHGSSVTTDAREKLDRYVNFPGKPEN